MPFVTESNVPVASLTSSDIFLQAAGLHFPSKFSLRISSVTSIDRELSFGLAEACPDKTDLLKEVRSEKQERRKGEGLLPSHFLLQLQPRHDR